MKEKDAQALLSKYYAGLCTEAEKALLAQWFHELKMDESSWLSEAEIETAHTEMWAAVQKGKDTSRVKKMWWPVIAAAASVLFIVSVVSFFFLHKPPLQQVAQNRAADIAPGSNKAILTLSKGRQIILTGAKNGQLAIENNAVIHKTADGQVVYDNVSTGTSEAVYNTISTPRGGQYRLTLADGTNVWLNAASSVKYPTAFTGNDRQVETTGEVYFEVAHDTGKPFKVNSNGQTITVLGTHFNVNAYSDEAAIRTTLLKGSVSVSAGLAYTIIKPGEQSVLHHDKISVVTADIEDAIAWKNGMFRFTNESLESVMRMVSRWYDVDVVFEDADVKDLPCNGITTRFDKVSKLLRMIELTKRVHFKIEGKKIIVLKS